MQAKRFLKESMKLFTSIVILLSIISNLHAQDYIINSNGDTLRVYIIKSFKATNTQKLTYKIAPESTSEEIFTPDKVRAFMAGVLHVSVKVKRETGEEQIFLQEIIAKGKIKLYKGIDENGNPEYFIRKEETILPIDRSNLESFIEQNFTDCPAFNKEKYLPLPNEAYRQDFLMDLVSHYNHCLDENIPYIRYYEPTKRRKQRDELHLGVKAGGGMQEYAYRSFGTGANAELLYGEGLFNWKPSFSVGFYGNVQYGKVFGMYLEATYLYRNTQSTDQRIELNFSGINLPFYGEFKMLHKKKVNPFVGIGLNVLVGIAQKYKFNDPPNIVQLRPLSISPVSFGYLFNFGTYIQTANKPLKFEFRFTEDFFEVNNRTFGDDKMRVANFMLTFSYPLL